MLGRGRVVARTESRQGAHVGSAGTTGLAGALVVVGLALSLSSAAGAATAARRPAPLSSIVLPALGVGYTVTSEGPLGAAQFPAGSPERSAGAGALASLGRTVQTYQRSWQDGAGVNQVQDLLVRFSATAGARAFVAAARRALAGGQIVSSGQLPAVPGAQRTTYFASTSQAGVGQAITLRVGASVAVLSFFSGASNNPGPITPAGAARVAKAQYAAMASAAGPTTRRAPAKGVSWADVGWTVLVVAVLAAAVVTPLVLRRRLRRDAVGPGPPVA
ncbi:MAG TPA: hypothetical protein VG244_08650 [Acidimicrobiales bacterium]|nr:hypothetical protein [Acidimicrobiales bacterium]